MAIAVSVGLSLIAGITIMYNTQYFWGKEDNPNICAMNSTMNELTNVTGTVGSIGLLVLTVLVLAIAVLVCTCRAGF